MTTIKVSEVVYREDLYPRFRPSPETIQQYAESIEQLPPIEVNQHNELIDGYHRWTAHKKAGKDTIEVMVTQTASDAELLSLALTRNSAHGLQLSSEEKKSNARKLYSAKEKDKKELSDLLKVSMSTLNNWLSDIDKAEREERKRRIFEMWLACHTQDEIAEVVGVTQKTVNEEIELLYNSTELQKSIKVQFLDDDFKQPIYNVWTFDKNTNNVKHPGNSEQRILDNLLYLYTKPFDIVYDPFGGGGATITVCQKRLRRYYVSDREPTPEHEHDIRRHDIKDGLPSLRWSDVSLVYLDPPYWKQVEGEYSTDADDLANMPLEQFTNSIVTLVTNLAAKLQPGSIVAMLMQPTQWKADNRQFTDHVFDIITGLRTKKLFVKNRVSCPYASQQYNAQQVEWAKEYKELLVLTRELVIWEIK